MDLEERIQEILEQWGYATVEEIANEVPISKQYVLKYLEENPGDYEVDEYGEWSIR